ncbi:S-layer homology domain-containing protein [Phormidesmis sp. 146-33]
MANKMAKQVEEFEMKNLLHGSILVAIVTLFNPLGASAQNLPKPESGCLSGYPDSTYRGDRPLTRNEFAAGMNACLDHVDRLIQINREGLATRADFEALIQRQRQLNDELKVLSDRVSEPQLPAKQ